MCAANECSHQSVGEVDPGPVSGQAIQGSNPRLINVSKNMMPSLLKDVRRKQLSMTSPLWSHPLPIRLPRPQERPGLIIKAVDRGLDFSATDGIDLVIMASSPSHRAY